MEFPVDDILGTDLESEQVDQVESVKALDSSATAKQFLSQNKILLTEATVQRDSEFHSLFPNLSQAEQLLQEFNCALEKEILVQGRMFLTKRHLCFYANIFGWVTALTIPFSDIESVEKRNVAGIIPNSIEIVTSTGKFFFASFLQREYAFNIIYYLWQEPFSNSIQMTTFKTSEPFSDLLQQDNLFTITQNPMNISEQRQENPPGLIANAFKKVRNISEGVVQTLSSSQEDKPLKLGSPTQGLAAIAQDKSVQEHVVTRTNPVEKILIPENRPLIPRRHSVDECTETVKKFACPCDHVHKSMVQVMDESFDCSVKDLFELLLSDKSSSAGFWHKFITVTRKCTQLQVSDWSGPLVPAVGSKRTFQHVTPLSNPLGPKQTLCTSQEEIKHVESTQIGYICLHSVSQTPDVPSGNCFNCLVRMCISSNGASSCRLRVSSSVEFFRFSFLQPVLASAVPEGMKEYYRELGKEIRIALETFVPSNTLVRVPSLEFAPTEPKEAPVDVDAIYLKLSADLKRMFSVLLFLLLFLIVLALANLFMLL